MNIMILIHDNKGVIKIDTRNATREEILPVS